MAPRRNDRAGAELIRKMQTVKEDVAKHRNEMEVTLNEYANERLENIERELKVSQIPPLQYYVISELTAGITCVAEC